MYLSNVGRRQIGKLFRCVCACVRSVWEPGLGMTAPSPLLPTGQGLYSFPFGPEACPFFPGEIEVSASDLKGILVISGECKYVEVSSNEFS